MSTVPTTTWTAADLADATAELFADADRDEVLRWLVAGGDGVPSGGSNMVAVTVARIASVPADIAVVAPDGSPARPSEPPAFIANARAANLVEQAWMTADVGTVDAACACAVAAVSLGADDQSIFGWPDVDVAVRMLGPLLHPSSGVPAAVVEAVAAHPGPLPEQTVGFLVAWAGEDRWSDLDPNMRGSAARVRRLLADRDEVPDEVRVAYALDPDVPDDPKWHER